MDNSSCVESNIEMVEQFCKRVNCNENKLYLQKNALQSFFHDNFSKAREWCETFNEELPLGEEISDKFSEKCESTLKVILEDAINSFYRWEDKQIAHERSKILSQKIYCSTKSVIQSTETPLIFTELQGVSNKCVNNNNNINASNNHIIYTHPQWQQELKESSEMLYERTTNQLQCLRYRHFLRSQQKNKLQNLLVKFGESDAARSRQREFELPLLVKDAIKYIAFLTSIMVNNKHQVNVDSNNTTVKESAISPVIFSKHGFALPYMQAPPPLFRCSSFATETVRLLKWLSTWDHAQQTVHKKHQKSKKTKHKTKRNHHVRHVSKTVQEQTETSHHLCDVDVAHNAYNNYRLQWLDAMKEGLPTMQAVSPVLSATSPVYLSSPCTFNSVEHKVNNYGKQLQESNTNSSSIDSSEGEALPKSTNSVNKRGNIRLLQSMPFHEEVEKENGLLGSSNIVYYDAFGNRLRSVRQARQQAEKLFATLANKEKMSKQKGYFQQDEIEKVKNELSSNPLLSACAQSSYNSRKRPRAGVKKHQTLRNNSISSSSSSRESSTSFESSDSSKNNSLSTSSESCEEEQTAWKRKKSDNHYVHGSLSVSQSSSNNNNDEFSSNSTDSSNDSESDEEVNMYLEEECTDEDNSSSITNIAVIGGPTGVGKTTAVYLAAELLQYRVVEMNASTLRCPRNVERLLAELTQSHRFTSFQTGRNVMEIEREFSKLKAKRQSEEVQEAQEKQVQEQEPSSPFAFTPEAQKHLSRSAQKERNKSSSEQLDSKHKKSQSNNKVSSKEAASVKKVKRNGISLNAVNAFFGIASQQEQVPHDNQCITVCDENIFHKEDNSNTVKYKENVKLNNMEMDENTYSDNNTCFTAAEESAQRELESTTTTTNADLGMTENNHNLENQNATEIIDLELEEEHQEQIEEEEEEHQYELSAEIESFDTSPTCCSPSIKSSSCEQDQLQGKLEYCNPTNKETAKEPKQKTLLLIEDADVMLGEEVAKVFYNSLKKLAMSSRIPIIITVTSQEPVRLENSISLNEEETFMASKTRDDELYIASLHDKNKHSFQTLSTSDNCQYVQFDKATAKQFFGEQTPYTYISPLSNAALFTELLTVAIVHANLIECKAEIEVDPVNVREEIEEEQKLCKHRKQQQKEENMRSKKRKCELEQLPSTQQENKVKHNKQEVQEENQEEKKRPLSVVIGNKKVQYYFERATLDESKVHVLENIAHSLLFKMFNSQGYSTCKDVRSWLNQLALHELHTWPNCLTVERTIETMEENRVIGKVGLNPLVSLSESLTTTVKETNYVQDAFFSSCWDAVYGRFVKCAVANKLNCPRQRLWECDSCVFQYSDDVCAEINAENGQDRLRAEYVNSKNNKNSTPERKQKEISVFEFMQKTIRESEKMIKNSEGEQYEEEEEECQEYEQEQESFVNIDDSSKNNGKEKSIVDLCNDDTPSSVNATKSVKSSNLPYSPFDSNLSSKNNSPASLKEVNTCKDMLYKFQYALELHKSFTPLPVHLISTPESDLHTQSWDEANYYYHTKQLCITNVSTQHITTREQEKENNVRLTCKRQRDIQHLFKNYIVGRDCSAYEDIVGFTDVFTH